MTASNTLPNDKSDSPKPAESPIERDAIELLVAVRESAVTDSGHCSICLADPHSSGCVIECVEKFIQRLDGDQCIHGRAFSESCEPCHSLATPSPEPADPPDMVWVNRAEYNSLRECMIEAADEIQRLRTPSPEPPETPKFTFLDSGEIDDMPAEPSPTRRECEVVIKYVPPQYLKERVSFDYSDKRNLYEITGGGYVLAETEDSEIADAICKMFNKAREASPEPPRQTLCKCGHSADEHDDGRLCCTHQNPRIASLMCNCMKFAPSSHSEPESEPCDACGKPDGINHTYDCPEAQQ